MAQRIRMNQYAVYEGDAKIMEGDKNEVSTLLGCRPNSVSAYARNKWLCQGKWTVEFIGKKTLVKENKKPDDPYERIKYHLTYHGNAVANEKDLKLLPQLEEEGFKFTITKFMDAPDEKLSIRTRQKQKKKYHYILERV